MGARCTPRRQCTWDLLQGKGEAKFRANPRKAWYWNLEGVTVNGDDEATFHLGQKQPAFIALLASGWSPVYPCHVPPAQMRQHPIGTGPFKFVEYKPGEYVRLVKNPDYWKPGLPYLDGIDFTIIPNRSTAMLAFAAGQFDMTYPYLLTVQLMKDLKSQMPSAECTLAPVNSSVNLIVNRDKPPFDNPNLRRAMALTLDRKSFIDILAEGKGYIGGAMLPPPVGIWGMPADYLKTVAGYDPDVAKNREAARAIMAKLGYGPDKHLAIKVSTRNLGPFKDPAVILIDQLKEIWIDGELEVIETANWFPKIVRKDYTVGLNLIWAGSTIPTSSSLKTTPAARSATTPAIATATSRSCSASSRKCPTRRRARSSSGRSTSSSRKTAPGPSSITGRERPAGGPRSRTS